jgi:hypothetical protein
MNFRSQSLENARIRIRASRTTAGLDLVTAHFRSLAAVSGRYCLGMLEVARRIDLVGMISKFLGLRARMCLQW